VAAQQQRVVIARAIARKARVLVLDEPTSCLGERDAEQLLDLVCRLREQGLAIVYISHRLNEIYALADRITVLHEGQVMGTLAGEAISTKAVIGLMSRGGAIEHPYRLVAHRQAAAVAKAVAPALLQATGLTDGRRIKPASFSIAGGEVLGLTGLVGSGRSRLCRLLCAADAPRGGSLRIDGRAVAFRGPAQALRAGVVYVPDTDSAGALFPRMSLYDNVTLGLVGQHRKLGLICDDAELARRSRSVIDRLQIRMADEGTGAASLSGGMRRKLALARGLVMQPRLLILDEPLKGLDPAAAADVQALIREHAARGMAVLWVSADAQEVVRVCDRALVMCEGEITGVLDAGSGPEWCEENMLAYATGMRRHSPAEAVCW
jgi:ribose transport system ATP-binding protein